MDQGRRRLITILGTTSSVGLAGCGGVLNGETADAPAYRQHTKLTAADGEDGDTFGSSVAISGDGSTAIVSDRGDDHPASDYEGSAYVFKRSENGWNQRTKFTPPDGDPDRPEAIIGDGVFGTSIDLSTDGSVVLVGAWTDVGPIGANAGQTFVFENTESGWHQQAKLTANDADRLDKFGGSVAVSGDGSIAVIGAQSDEDPNGDGSGSAYVFDHSESGWNQLTKLVALDGDDGDRFGWSVALSNDGHTAIIGAPSDEDPNGETAGSAYVFSATESGWAQRAKLTADDGNEQDGFGGSVTISNDGTTAIIGASTDEDPNGERSGSAYIFTDSGKGWRQKTKLAAEESDQAPPTRGVDLDFFGTSVAISSDGVTAIIGAHGDKDPNEQFAGSAYVFTNDENSWRQLEKLTANDGDEKDRFGGSIAVSTDGHTVIIGAHGDEDSNDRKVGSAYVFGATE